MQGTVNAGVHSMQGCIPCRGAGHIGVQGTGHIVVQSWLGHSPCRGAVHAEECRPSRDAVHAVYAGVQSMQSMQGPVHARVQSMLV
jgi:hypothetical protein